MPPHPQDSLPTPQYWTLKGSRSPFAARSSARLSVPAGALQYETRSWNSAGVLEPTFAATYGSAPIKRQSCMNSWMPNWFVSVESVPAGMRRCQKLYVRWTRGALSYSVAPVIAIGKAAAWPAQVRRSNALHVVDELLADSLYVGNARVWADPDAVVNDAPKMLDEMPVYIRADQFPGFAR